MGAQTAPFYFLFPVAIITVVFAFTAVVHFVNSRRQEREALIEPRRCGGSPKHPAKGPKRPSN